MIFHVMAVAADCILMARLRQKHSHTRSWEALTRDFRSTGSDKKANIEVIDRALLLKHLEKIQDSFSVTSQSLLFDRLDLLCRRLGLQCSQKLNSAGGIVTLTSDVFHVRIDITLDSGNCLVKDVYIYKNGDYTSPCVEMKTYLNERKFTEFAQHLEGLVAVTSVCSERKTKAKIFLVLQALETDLFKWSQHSGCVNQSATNTGWSFLIANCHQLGQLHQSVEGLPMRVTYFVGPYDFLNKKPRISYAVTNEAVATNRLGCWANISLRAHSDPCRLPVMPLLPIGKLNDTRSMPTFTSLSHMNSIEVSAVFVLQLHQPIPMSRNTALDIQKITGLKFVDTNKQKPLLALLAEQGRSHHSAWEFVKNGTFVRLPRQNHRYFFNTQWSEAGVVISEIPFTHPTHVYAIIPLLRQQAIFNSVLSSCIRLGRDDGKDVRCLTFELTPLSMHSLSVTFEHPWRDKIISVDFDFADITSPKAKLVGLESLEFSICDDKLASQIFKRCLSVPVTMRHILLKAAARVEEECKMAIAVSVSRSSHISLDGRLAQLSTSSSDTSRKSRKSITAAGNSAATTVSVVSNVPAGMPPLSIAVTSRQISLESISVQHMQSSPSMSLAKNPMLMQLLDGAMMSKSSGNSTVLLPSVAIESLAKISPTKGLQMTEMISPGGSGSTPMLSQLLMENATLDLKKAVLTSTGKVGGKRKNSTELIPGRSPKRLVSKEDILQDVTILSNSPAVLTENSSVITNTGFSFAARPANGLNVGRASSQSLPSSANIAGGGGETDDSVFLPESHVSKLAFTVETLTKQSLISPGAISPSVEGSLVRNQISIQTPISELHNQSDKNVQRFSFGDGITSGNVGILGNSGNNCLRMPSVTDSKISDNLNVKLSSGDLFSPTEPPLKVECIVKKELVENDVDSKIVQNSSDYKVDVKKKERKKKDIKSESDENMHPPERITVKLNTRELIAKTVVKDVIPAEIASDRKSESTSFGVGIDVSLLEKVKCDGSAAGTEALQSVWAAFSEGAALRMSDSVGGSSVSAVSEAPKKRKKKSENEDAISDKKRKKISCSITETKISAVNNSNKQKIYDFEESETTDSPSAPPPIQSGVKAMPKIKITATGGKHQVQSGVNDANTIDESHMKASKTSSVQRGGLSSRGKHRLFGKSTKGDGLGANSEPEKPATPTSKKSLKTAPLPSVSGTNLQTGLSSAKVSLNSTQSATKMAVALSLISGTVTLPEAVSTTAPVNASEKDKKATLFRSLSDVIEKLKSTSQVPCPANNARLYDEMRLAIIREGNKPSTPTRDLAVTTAIATTVMKTIPTISKSKAGDSSKKSQESVAAKLTSSSSPINLIPKSVSSVASNSPSALLPKPPPLSRAPSIVTSQESIKTVMSSSAAITKSVMASKPLLTSPTTVLPPRPPTPSRIAATVSNVGITRPPSAPGTTVSSVSTVANLTGTTSVASNSLRLPLLAASSVPVTSISVSVPTANPVGRPRLRSLAPNVGAKGGNLPRPPSGVLNPRFAINVSDASHPLNTSISKHTVLSVPIVTVASSRLSVGEKATAESVLTADASTDDKGEMDLSVDKADKASSQDVCLSPGLSSVSVNLSNCTDSKNVSAVKASKSATVPKETGNERSRKQLKVDAISERLQNRRQSFDTTLKQSVGNSSLTATSSSEVDCSDNSNGPVSLTTPNSADIAFSNGKVLDDSNVDGQHEDVTVAVSEKFGNSISINSTLNSQPGSCEQKCESYNGDDSCVLNGNISTDSINDSDLAEQRKLIPFVDTPASPSPPSGPVESGECCKTVSVSPEHTVDNGDAKASSDSVYETPNSPVTSICNVKRPVKVRPPRSEDSSPEDGLIIDYPDTPSNSTPKDNVLSSAASTGSASGTTAKLNQPAALPADTLVSGLENKIIALESEAVKVQSIMTVVVGTASDGNSSPALSTSGTTYAQSYFSNSPERDSPCEIDDDLMNEALMYHD